MSSILYVICTSTLPLIPFPRNFTSQRGHNRREVLPETPRFRLHPILISLQGGPSTWCALFFFELLETNLFATYCGLRWIVWAMFWIAFQLGSLIGFIFIGIVSFKLTTDEMNSQAGKFLAKNPSCVIDEY